MVGLRVMSRDSVPYRTGRQVPGPAGRFLVGNTIEYERDRLGFLLRAQSEYGDVFRFDKATVVVLDPDLIHDLFMRTNREFRVETPVLETSDSVARMADLMRTAIAGRRARWMGLHKRLVSTHVVRMIGILEQFVRRLDGHEVNVLSAMREFSTRIVADFCLGVADPALTSAVLKAASAALPLMSAAQTLPRWFPSTRIRRAVAARTELNARVASLVIARRAEKRDCAPEDFLDVLLDSEYQLDDNAVVVNLVEVLRVSAGVPGAALTWIVRELALRPDIMQRVHIEAAVLDNALPATATSLPYTEAVVKELLRAYPPAWLLGRDVIAPTTLGGWALEPNEQVMFSPYVVHRDPRWWDRPAEVLPERWLEPIGDSTRRAYLPFGSGPRMCPGNHLAMLQLTLCLAWLTRRCKIEVINASTARIEPNALFAPVNLMATFTCID
jgi:unspecific monooxygenase